MQITVLLFVVLLFAAFIYAVVIFVNSFNYLSCVDYSELIL